jgi:hypothetical protein
MSEKDVQNKFNTPIQDLVESTQKNGTVGPIVGSIIVILLIIIGGLYYMGSMILSKKAQIEERKSLEEQTITIQVEETVKQSDSDDVQSIEADLGSTNIDSLDQRLSDIEKEF